MLAVIYIACFIFGMYGLYQIKHGYMFKGFIKLGICVALWSLFAGVVRDDNAEKKSQQHQEQQQIENADLNKNFDDKVSVEKNMDNVKQ